MQEATINIDGFIEATGRLDDPTWPVNLPALVEISSLKLLGLDQYKRPCTLRFASAPRAAVPCIIDGRRCEHSHLILRRGRLIRQPDGSFLPVTGEPITALSVFLYLPTPLSVDMAGYWLVFKIEKRGDQWQINLSDLTPDPARVYFRNNGNWGAQLLRDLVFGGTTEAPLNKLILEWKMAYAKGHPWCVQAPAGGHPLLNRDDGALLRIASPNFSLGVKEDPDHPNNWEVVASLADTDAAADTLRELDVASMTGAPPGTHQPATLFYQGKVLLEGVIDETGTDPLRDRFALELRIPGDAGNALVSVRALWALLARHYTLGLAASGSRNRLSFVPDDIAFADAVGSNWCARFLVTRSSGAWPVRLVELVPGTRGMASTATLRLAGATDRSGLPPMLVAALDTDKVTPLIATGHSGFEQRPLLALALRDGTGMVGSPSRPVELVVGAALMRLAKFSGMKLQVRSRSPLFSYSQAPLEATLHLAFDGSMLKPVSQDPEIGFETLSAWLQRERPITVDLSPSEDNVAYQVYEVSGQEQSRILRIGVTTLRGARPAAVDAVIIDTNPFLVARVCAMSSNDLQAGTLLAEYTDDAELSPEWTYFNPTGQVTMTLPPQGIGEELIKNEDSGPAAGNLFDFRLSPVARLAIDLSDIDVARPLAPWGLRRLFSQRPGTIGAKTDAAQFELLYGLTTDIRVDGLRLAEVDAFTGRVPFSDDLAELYRSARANPETPTGPYAYAQQVAGWIGNLLHRPAKLTLFRDPTEREQLTITEGVSFGQRRSRQTAHPFAPDKQPPNADPYVPEPDAGPGRRLLRGGVDTMFESPAIAAEFWGDKTPGAGHVVGVSFGALGGSGHQQAAFNEGKTLVLTDTTDGRIDSVTLIRKGRIAVLWNHARHVIVYERSVRTAPRYRNDQPGGFEGLAAVRKVREYIEITQPRRAFPDTAATTPINGPVLAATFDTIVIPIKSSWGWDTMDGWVAALRGPLAPTEEQYYPFPRIFFELARAKEKGGGHVSQMVADPSQLFFFTSTHPDDRGDTDTWPPVPGIDYSPMGRPQPPTGIRVPGPVDAMQPDAARHDIGQRDFTIDLVPSEDGVNLMHGRKFDGIEARVVNLTLARGDIRPSAELLGERQRAQAFNSAHTNLSDGVDDLVSRLRSLAQPGAPDQHPATLPPVLQAKASEIIERAKQDILSVQLAGMKAPLNWLERQAALKEATLAANARRWADTGELGAQLDAAVSAIAQLTDPVAVRVRLKDGLDHVSAQLREQLDGTRDALDFALDSMAALLGRLETQALDWAADQQGLLMARIDRLEALAGASARQTEATLATLEKEFDTVWQRAAHFREQLVRQAQAGLTEWFAGGDAGAWPGSAAFGDDTSAEFGLAVEVWLDDCRLAAGESDGPDWQRMRLLVDGFDLPPSVFDSARQLLQDLEAQSRTVLDAARQRASEAVAAAGDRIKKAMDQMSIAELHQCEAKLKELLGVALSEFGEFQDAAKELLTGLPATYPGSIWSKVVEQVQSPQALAAEAADQLDKLLHGFGTGTAIESALELVQQHAGMARASMQALGAQFETAVAAQVGDWRKQAEGVLEQSMATMRMLASGPITDTIETTRRFLGYYNDPAVQALATTPASALFNRTVGDVLSPLAAAMPFDALRERLLPQLAGVRVADLFPSFAGLDMSFLLAALDIDDSDLERSSEYGWITMTHRFDKDRLMPVSFLDVDKQFPDEATLFNLPPFSVALYRPHFVAHSEVRPTLRQQDTRGSLKADWIVKLGDKAMVTIRGATLRFDSGGGFDFDMEPNAVELDESLRFLTDALALMKPEGSGVMVSPQLPGGISATLDLPLPDIGSGAFTLTSLSLHLHFDLLFAPRFELRTGLWLAQPDRPFGLAILFLGGGGWFGVDLAYQPPDIFTTRVSIGISAGAFVAINFGVASGSAGLLFTAGLEFSHSSNARSGNGTAVSIGLLVWGEFSICGIASAYLRLVLTVTQQPGGQMVGRGRVQVRIRICWCFTLKVSSPVNMPFVGRGTRVLALTAAAMSPDQRVERALQAFFANLDL